MDYPLAGSRIAEDRLVVGHETTAAAPSMAQWGAGLGLHSALRRPFLAVVEQSGITRADHHYFDFRRGGRSLGCANVFVSETDFAAFDQLSAAARQTMEMWFPDFMRLRMTECGFFTMIGEGLHVADKRCVADCLASLDDEMASVARETKSQFLLIRDIPVEKFEKYYGILRGRGYFPALGFPNAVLPVKWPSLEAYLAARDGRTRLKLRNCLRLEEKYGIDAEFRDDYAALAGELAALWKKANRRAKAQRRETLSERFFRACGELLPNNSEVLLYKHRGRLIGFVLNLYGDDDYVMLDWGFDYDYEHYRQANLCWTSAILSLGRAIERGTKRLELGSTHYVPKMALGADIVPLVYFVRHVSEPRYSRVLAKLLSESIVQPDGAHFDSALTRAAGRSDLPSVRSAILQTQSDLVGNGSRKNGGRVRTDAVRLAANDGIYPGSGAAEESCFSFSDRRETILLGINAYLAPYLREIFNQQGALNRYSVAAPPISPREMDVLNWAKEGKSNWDIANILGISERTVKFHFSNLFRKLDVVNRSQAITKAIQYGLLSV